MTIENNFYPLVHSDGIINTIPITKGGTGGVTSTEARENLGVINAPGDLEDYVIDSGSNANGNWEKWSNGKLIQWGDTGVQTVNFDLAWGGALYHTRWETPVTFPIPFTGFPQYINFIPADGPDGYGNSMGVEMVRVVNTTEIELIYASIAVRAQNVKVRANWLAIGRWKE